MICTNLPCALRGANEAADHLKKRIGCGWNETSADGRFTLKEGECFGACGDAPVMLVNNKRMAELHDARGDRQIAAGARVKSAFPPFDPAVYGPDAIIMKGINGAELASRRTTRRAAATTR